MAPAVQAALQNIDSIRFLYHLGPAFTGFTAGAMWGDMKVGLGRLRSWKRVAVVTDHKWVEGALRLFLFAMPCSARLFPDAELAEAERWVAA